MRRTILWVTEARTFIVVGFVVILAFMLWVAATAPPTTMSANAASAQYIDYFALGDSVASGHGLGGEKGDCRRSAKAYPWEVSRLLAKRYVRVDTTHLACSGAKSTKLKNQVDTMLARSKDITDDPILVSITIGVNDFEFADKEKAEYHLRCDDAWVKKAFPKEYYCGQTDAEFHLWVEKTRAAVKAQVRYQVEERLHKEKPNAVVVITDYYDPLKDIKPIYFTKNIKKGPVEAEVVCSTCEERWRYAITRLNDVFPEIRNELGNPQWLQLTGDQEPKAALPIRERFVEHEAPAPECGKVDRPGKSWILPKSPEKVNDPKTLRDDCVHPNAEGAKQIAKTVNFEASKAGR